MRGAHAVIAPLEEHRAAGAAQPPVPSTTSGSLGELPDWLTGILNEADKTQIVNKQTASAAAQPAPPPARGAAPGQNGIEQPVSPHLTTSTSWLTDDVKPINPAQ